MEVLFPQFTDTPPQVNHDTWNDVSRIRNTSTSPPRVDPRAFDLSDFQLSNSPPPGPQTCSNAPPKGPFFEWRSRSQRQMVMFGHVLSCTELTFRHASETHLGLKWQTKTKKGSWLFTEPRLGFQTARSETRARDLQVSSPVLLSLDHTAYNLEQKLLRQVPRIGTFTFLYPWNASSPPPSAQCRLPVCTMSLAVSSNRNNIERRGREDVYRQSWENTTGLVVCLTVQDCRC